MLALISSLREWIFLQGHPEVFHKIGFSLGFSACWECGVVGVAGRCVRSAGKLSSFGRSVLVNRMEML